MTLYGDNSAVLIAVTKNYWSFLQQKTPNVHAKIRPDKFYGWICLFLMILHDVNDIIPSAGCYLNS